LVKWEERFGSDEIGAVFCYAVGDAVGREEFGDGGGAALVPDFFEPAFLRWRCWIRAWVLLISIPRNVRMVSLGGR